MRDWMAGISFGESACNSMFWEEMGEKGEVEVGGRGRESDNGKIKGKEKNKKEKKKEYTPSEDKRGSSIQTRGPPEALCLRGRVG